MTLTGKTAPLRAREWFAMETGCSRDRISKPPDAAPDPMPLRRFIAAALLAATLLFGAGQARAVETGYARALRLREALDATPRAERTGEQYRRVLRAFRAVYHADRADPDAAASVEAAAELLAEEGRVFRDPALLRAAVEQLEFLRRNFGASPFSIPALLTQGEIEKRDLHDGAEARARFTQFVASYPHSALAPQARAELRRLERTSGPETTELSQEVDEGVVGDETANPNRSSPAAALGKQVRTVRSPEGGEEHSEVSEGSRVRSETAAPAEVAERANVEAAAPSPAAHPSSVVNGVPVYRTAAQRADAPGDLAEITGIRHWSTASYTRIAIDVESPAGEEPPFEASRVPNPDRIFFDLHGARLARELAGRAVTVTDGGFLQRIRAAQFSGDVVRVVLDVSDVSDYSAFWLPNPSRLIIDVHGRANNAPPPAFASASAPGIAAGSNVGDSASLPLRQTKTGAPPPVDFPASQARASLAQAPTSGVSAPVPAPHTPSARDAAAGTPSPRSAHTAAAGTFVAETAPAGSPGPTPAPRARPGDSMAAIAALSRQPSRVRATDAPTTAPVAAIAPAAPGEAPADRAASSGKRRRRPATAEPDPAFASGSIPTAVARAAEPDATGSRSMVRALGLKINRIVIDAGHGGHDSGTLGPGGIEEKNIVLDVALRLGKLLKQRLGADVIYTRDDDTFIPLETRTAIANKAQADLFISIHANSSPDPSARGVETYYLNFTTSTDALEVAARENAVSDESIHQLSDLVKKITLQDKIAESREFAADVEGSLYQGLETGNAGLKDRGVKKAPFVVLIGANMPSILAEISFLTNPDDATELRAPAYRERIAESLYKGVARYMHSLSGTRLEESAGTR